MASKVWPTGKTEVDDGLSRIRVRIIPEVKPPREPEEPPGLIFRFPAPRRAAKTWRL